MDNQMNEKIEAVVTKIFYSVATNGKAEASINAGINDVKNLLAFYAAATPEKDWTLIGKCGPPEGITGGVKESSIDGERKFTLVEVLNAQTAAIEYFKEKLGIKI